MSELKEIKDCPFCGGEAKTSFYGENRYVLCTSCGAKSGSFQVGKDPSLNNIDVYNQAIDSWNKRHE